MKKELTYLETVKLIDEAKKYLEHQLEMRLELTKVQSPIFLKTSSGLQDGLSGSEKAVCFKKGRRRFRNCSLSCKMEKRSPREVWFSNTHRIIRGYESNKKR